MRYASVTALLLLQLPLVAQAEDYTLHTFTKVQLSDKFWADAATLGDINQDGINDVVVGPYWYEGPDFKKRHEFYPATHTFKAKKLTGGEVAIEGYNGALGSGEITGFGDSLFVTVVDLNGDGWPDILRVEVPNEDFGRSKTLAWYENPGPALRHGDHRWKRHVVSDQVDNQSVDFVDLLGDGHLVLLCMSHEQVGYLKPDPRNPQSQWHFHPISWRTEEFQWYTHGLGYGDINGDGRKDVLNSDGWWEQPASLVNDPIWVYHPYPFNLGPDQAKQYFWRGYGIGGGGQEKKGPVLVDVAPDGVPTMGYIYGGSQMVVDDVNGDGLPDVVTSIAAHGWGLVWWEQLKDRTDWWGKLLAPNIAGPQFRRHIIINEKPSENKYGVRFSEMQALAWADIDSDGLKDIVVGKNFWHHGSSIKGGLGGLDPESDAPAVLYWFKQVRHSDKSVEFIPYLIDSDSGAGTQITVGDVNGDGHPDIVVANKKGAFVFLQEVKRVTQKEWEEAQPPMLFPNAQ